MKKVNIRQSIAQDHDRTEYITREAFWDVYKPGCDEHLILHNLRNSRAYIKEFDLVAVYRNEICGHIICTKAMVTDAQMNEHVVLCAGPLSVSPEFQNEGIGSKLIIRAITEAKRLNYPGMIVFGNPEYYHRFGFKNAAEYGITTKDDQNFEPFMALELKNNGLKDVKGKFYEAEAFSVGDDDLAEFEKKFPFKEKHRLPTQLWQG